MKIPENADRDFTSSSYIIKNRKILLIKHKKAGLWLQPGGHIEENETPPQTAKRETREETGLKIKIDTQNQKIRKNYSEDAADIPRPFKVNIHKIDKGHWHCDFGYIATVKKREKPTNSEEHKGIKWFKKSELKDIEIPENVKHTAREAIEQKNKR